MSDGARRFLFRKVFLYVDVGAAERTTLEVVDPPDARIYYTDSATWMSGRPDRDVLDAAATAVTVTACGSDLTGYFGGLLITSPSCVTLRVRPQGADEETIHVPAAGGTC